MIGAIASHYVVSGGGGGYPAEVMADTPLAYYRLGEASGTTMVDSSGNARHGSYVGAVNLGATGLLAGDTDKCADFAGGRGDVADAAWMDVSAFTVEAWFVADAVSGTFAIATHSDWQVGPNVAGRSWHLIIQNGKINFGLSMTDGTFHDAGEGTAIAAGTRYHVAATWDGTTAKVTLNNSLDWSSTALSGKTLRTSDRPLRIGAGSASSGAIETFDGRLDDVAHYGSALSPGRIAAHYAAGIAA